MPHKSEKEKTMMMTKKIRAKKMKVKKRNQSAVKFLLTLKSVRIRKRVETWFCSFDACRPAHSDPQSKRDKFKVNAAAAKKFPRIA